MLVRSLEYAIFSSSRTGVPAYFLISTVSFRFVPIITRQPARAQLYTTLAIAYSPRNLAFPALSLLAHIPSTVTAATHKSYHVAVSSGTVLSIMMVHRRVASGSAFSKRIQ